EAVECVRGRDDADLVAAAVAGERELRRELPYLLDTDLPRILLQPQPAYIGMRRSRHAAARSALRARGRFAALTQHQRGGPGGEPLAACTGRLVDEERVRHAALLVGRAECGRRSDEPGRCGSRCRSAHGAVNLPSMLATLRCTSSSGAVASITWMRPGSRRASARYPARTLSKKSTVSASNRSAPPRCRARARERPAATGRSSSSVQCGVSCGCT